MPNLTTPAILLRTHPFSDSSRVLRFYARDLGLVGVMARGVHRGASRGQGGVGTFAEGVAVISFRENRDLQTLREFAPARAHLALGADVRRLAGASVAAELVLRHAGQEPHPQLFDSLSKGLERIEQAAPGEVIGEALALGWRIVQVLGFGPELTTCTACGSVLEEEEMARFDLEAGGIRGPGCPAAEGSRRVGPVARAQLGTLLRGQVPDGLRGARAHVSLLDDFTTFHMLGGRRLESFRFLEPDADAGAEVSARN